MSRSTSWFKSPHFQCGGHGFEPRTRYFFGIGYGDGRLCKSLADKFESCISHLFCLRNSVGLEYRAFNTGVASSSLAGGTYFTRLWWNGIITVSKTAVSSSNLGRRAIYASLAQWLELLFCKQGVVGSSPTWSSIFYTYIAQLVRAFVWYAKGYKFESCYRYFYI